MLDQRIGLLMTIAAGMVFAIWLGVQVGHGSYVMVIALSLAIVGAVSLARTRKHHQALLVVLILLPGRGLLLGGFGYWDALAIGILLLWALRALMLRALPFRVHGRLTFAAILVYCGILLGHYAANRLGVGTGSEGGLRLAVLAALTMSVCLLIQSGQLSTEGNKAIPLLGLLPGLFDGSIEIVNHLVPSAMRITYAIYTSINWEVVASMRAGGGVSVFRLAGLRVLGLTIGLFCCTLLGVRGNSTIRKRALLYAGMLAAVLLVLIAGYRGYLMVLLIAYGIAFWTRYRLGAAWLVLACVLILSGLSIWHIQVAPLPLTVQRTLSWFPGKWDSAIMADTSQGWVWRREIWDRFMTSVFPHHPWFGQGLQYVASRSGYAFTYRATPELFFVDAQSLHSGLFSALDFVGIVGLTGIIAVSLRGICSSLVILTRRRTKIAPWMLWVIAYFLGNQPIFWITGSFERSFMPISICAAVIEVIRRQTSEDAGAPGDCGAASRTNPAFETTGQSPRLLS